MLEDNYITESERAKAVSAPLGLDPKKKDPLDPSAYFAEEVRRHLYETYGEEALYRGGMKVHTTMDSALQTMRLCFAAKGADVDHIDGAGIPGCFWSDGNWLHMCLRLR